MFQAIRNMSIYRRLFFVFALATIVPSIVIISLGVFYLHSSQGRSDAVGKSFEAKDLAAEQQNTLQHLNPLLQVRFAQVIASPQNNQIINGDPSFEASGALVENDIASLVVSFQENLRAYQQNYDLATASNMSQVRSILLTDDAQHNQSMIDIQHRALANVVQDDWVNYENDVNALLGDLHQESLSYAAAYKDLYQANTDFLVLSTNWQIVFNMSTSTGDAVTHVGISLILPLFIGTFAALLFVVLIGLGNRYLINVTISNPLRQLVSLTRRVAAGDTNERAPVNSNDEIGKVAESMNGMLDNIVRLVRDAEAKHAALETQIARLVNEVSGIGEGNLRIHADVTSNELGVLAESFNYIAEELGILVVNVKTLAHQVQDSTVQTYRHMTELVANADTGIQQIRKAENEMKTLSFASTKVVERAQALQTVAGETRQNASAGRNALIQTFSGIERIHQNVHVMAGKIQSLGDRSREVSHIMGVITSIASQTNRLAIDAAIQAAMAGENGKGFGAVAVDIRRQAERAKEQATLMNQTVSSFFADIDATTLAIREAENEAESGSHFVQKAGSAFQTVFWVVEQQANQINSINQVVMQLLRSSDVIVSVMHILSDMTQKGSVVTHNTARAMEALAQLASQLRTSVEVFNVGDIRNQST